MALFVYYYSTNVPSTELNLDFLWIPLETDVILPAFPFPGTQVGSERFYHLQVMLSNSIQEIIQFILSGSCRWDGDVGAGGSHCVTHRGWGWLHHLWAPHLAEIV